MFMKHASPYLSQQSLKHACKGGGGHVSAIAPNEDPNQTRSIKFIFSLVSVIVVVIVVVLAGFW